MLDSLSIVMPVFGLIAIGYAAGRLQLLKPETGAGVADFAFTIGLPAVLFRTVANANLADTAPLGVLAAFFGAAWSVWIVSSLLTRHMLRRPAADAPAIAMSAVFGNTIMLGVPLSLASFGNDAAGPIAVILAVHAALLWMTGTMHMEWIGADRDAGAPSGRAAAMARGLVRDLTRNPIILGVIAGMAWRVTGVALPGPVDKTLALLVQAGIPCALVALGLTLVKFEIKGQWPTLISIVGLKLVAMPAIAYALVKLLALPPVPAGVVVTFAAVPTGANAFLFATRHDRAVNSSSGAVALGTILAVVTVSVILSVLRG